MLCYITITRNDNVFISRHNEVAMEYGLQEIANKLGLSVSTVSRVVNNKGNVKESTRQEVLRALDQYGYSPNFLARSLKSNKTKTVGVIVPDITEGLFGNIIKGINDVMDAQGYSVVFCDSDENVRKEEKYLQYLSDIRVDGLIVAMVKSNEKIIQELFGKKRPIVMVDNLFDYHDMYDSVTIDNFQAGYKGTEYLIQKGHKQIGIIIGSLEQTTGKERLKGYLHAMEKYNLPVQEGFIQAGDYKENSGYCAMQAFLDGVPQVTAVFATSSKMTFGAVKLLRERQMIYKKDISLLGFDVADEMEMFHPRITSIVQPDRRIGNMAAEILIKRLESPTGTVQRVFLDFHIAERETV